MVCFICDFYVDVGRKKLKKCFLDFIWDGKPPRIAYNTIIGEVGKGGMGLIDVEQRQNSLRVKVK